jgi:hypothetical protein
LIEAHHLSRAACLASSAAVPGEWRPADLWTTPFQGDPGEAVFADSAGL